MIFTFDASASKSFIQSDSKLTYHWNFGDGTSEDSNSPQTTHQYNENGNFVAELIVTDAAGNKEYSDKFLNLVEPIEHADGVDNFAYLFDSRDKFYSGKPPSKVSSLSLDSAHTTVFSAKTNPIFQKKRLFLGMETFLQHSHDVSYSQYNTYLNGGIFKGGTLCEPVHFITNCENPSDTVDILSLIHI